jgi:hypothetical protein
MDKFEREVDPEGKLTIQERAKRAEWAHKAYMQRLALRIVSRAGTGSAAPHRGRDF